MCSYNIYYLVNTLTLGKRVNFARLRYDKIGCIETNCDAFIFLDGLDDKKYGPVYCSVLCI